MFVRTGFAKVLRFTDFLREVYAVKEMQVSDLMLDVSVCRSIGEQDTVYQAIKELSDAASEFAGTKYPLDMLLVKDSEEQVLGILTLNDLLAGLEPGYTNLGDLSRISFSGLTPEVLTMLRESYGLWQKPLSELCQKASRVRIAAVFEKPLERQFIRKSAPLNEAIHRLIINDEAWLLAEEKDRIVGLLRICDVFSEVSARAKQCKI